MAFSCLKDGQKISSFHYTPSQWQGLKSQRNTFDLTMACCGQPAVMKTSTLGTQFFAHKSRPNPETHTTNPESKEHQYAKYLISQTLYQLGWEVDTEKRGETPDGEIWIADVYAQKNQEKIAVEVQWSPQTYQETALRQSLYTKSGVKCIWLLKSHKRSSVNALTGDYAYRTYSVPVFTLTKNDNSQFIVRNIHFRNHETMILTAITLPLNVFIEQIFSKKFFFMPRGNGQLHLQISLLHTDCWRCKQPIKQVAEIQYYFYVYGRLGFVDWNRLPIHLAPQADIDFINQVFQPHCGFSPLRPRYSNTTKTTYIANSCPYCDALQGQFFLFPHKNKEDIEKTSIVASNRFHDDAEHNKELGQWVIAGSKDKPVLEIPYRIDTEVPFKDVAFYSEDDDFLSFLSKEIEFLDNATSQKS